MQVRCFGEGLKRLFGGFNLNGEKHKSGMSSFQAVATAIAAQVGTGNIVGACGAILIGGPGAIFWMWLIAFLGMATNYAEAVLAQKTRKVDADGTVHGGPVYYIKTAFHGKFGTFGWILCSRHHLGAGLHGLHGSVELHRIHDEHRIRYPHVADGHHHRNIRRLHLPGWLVPPGIGNRKGSTPFMAIVYLIGGIAVLIANRFSRRRRIFLIFEFAFNPNAELGALPSASSQLFLRALSVVSSPTKQAWAPPLTLTLWRM